jgi:hypothetical protein
MRVIDNSYLDVSSLEEILAVPDNHAAGNATSKRY